MSGLLLGLVLLAGNAFFVGAEFALLSARRTKLDAMAAAGSKRAGTTARASGRLSPMLAGTQLGITVCSLGLGAVAEPALAHLLEPALESLGAPAAVVHGVAFAIALTVVVALHMVLGEMVPKNLALAAPERVAVMLGPPMVRYSRIAGPLLTLVNGMANGVLRLIKVQPQDEVNATYSGRQLVGVLGESHEAGLLDADEHGLAAGALVLEHTTAADAMVPIADVATVPDGATVAQIEALVARTRLSRFPVQSGDGEVAHYMHVYDLVAAADAGQSSALSAGAKRPLVSVPADLPLARVLLELRHARRHLARVVDPAANRTIGILSLDDVVEPLLTRRTRQ